ncbi:MAG: hypothetical protein U5S82_01460 [Gammaproteobacteria bacterium]|nr:hypothetical protein [Gammaproteobacteria bacterium]
MRDAAPKALRACELCGLTVYEDRHLLRSAGHLLHFCCPGCRQAYVISRAVHDAEFPAATTTSGYRNP